MDRSHDADRRSLLGAVAGLAGLAYAVEAGAAPPAAATAGTRPRQAWAHRDGKIAMRASAPLAGSPADILMIQDAFGRYGMAHDEGQNAVLTSLFTHDAVVDVAEGSGTPFQSVKGGRAIVANFGNVFSQQRDQRRHCFTNVLVESIAGDRARALAYALVTVAADGLALGATVIYTADLRRVDGLWRFAYLFIGMDAYTTAKPKV